MPNMDYYIEVRNKSSNEVQIVRLHALNIKDAKGEGKHIAKNEFGWSYAEILIRPLLEPSDWFGLRVNGLFIDMYADFERCYTNKKD